MSLLGGGDHRDRIAERGVGRQVEADGDGRKLLLVGDRQAARWCTAICATALSGTWVAPTVVSSWVRDAPAVNEVGLPRPGCRRRQIELGERCRIALILRQRLQDHAVLVGLAVDGGNLPLPEGVVQACRLIACMETPSRPAVSRSTCTSTRKPPSCASEATSRSSGAARSSATSVLAQWPTSSAVGAGQRVLELRAAASGCGSGCPAPAGNTRPCPASRRPRCFEPLDDAVDDVSLRSSRGLSVMARRPALGVGLSGVTPTTETTPVTSGSACGSRRRSRCAGAASRRRRRPGRPRSRR